uniref:Uncharacterized protein n=1 Tax=Pogona vitticeps TaxID=103695 RepID=A0ABM5GL57_9SAUR
MADKENKDPEAGQKVEEQKAAASMDAAKPRKRYMSTDSDSENGPPVALKRLEDPVRPCHPGESSCYNEKASETQEMQHLQAGGVSLKKHKDMQALTRACLFAMLKDALSEHLIQRCYGCQEDICAQQAHPCIGWNEAEYSKMLNEICEKLCYKKVILIITLAAFRNKMLCMTNQNVNYIHKIIKRLSVSGDSYKLLKRLLRSTDEKYLDIAKLTIELHNDHYYCCPSMHE